MKCGPIPYFGLCFGTCFMVWGLGALIAVSVLMGSFIEGFELMAKRFESGTDFNCKVRGATSFSMPVCNECSEPDDWMARMEAGGNGDPANIAGQFVELPCKTEANPLVKIEAVDSAGNSGPNPPWLGNTEDCTLVKWNEEGDYEAGEGENGMQDTDSGGERGAAGGRAARLSGGRRLSNQSMDAWINHDGAMPCLWIPSDGDLKQNIWVRVAKQEAVDFANDAAEHLTGARAGIIIGTLVVFLCGCCCFGIGCWKCMKGDPNK